MKYQKTQTGWIVIILMPLVILLLTFAYIFKVGNNPLPFTAYLIIMIVFLVIFLLFYQLKVIVDESKIHIIYGIGLIHIKIQPLIIHQIQVVKVPWIYGLGIRFTNKGMLYNIQGRGAVQITYQEAGSEKNVMIGSPDPIALKESIEKSFYISPQ